MEFLDAADRDFLHVFGLCQDEVQGILVIQQHHGFLLGLAGGGLFLLQEFFGLQKGIRISFDLGGFPAEIDAQAFHFLAVFRRRDTLQVAGKLRLQCIQT